MAEEEIEHALQGMVTLQERMVHLIQQLSMPLVEVSMVISKQISSLMKSQSLERVLLEELYFFLMTKPQETLTPTLKRHLKNMTLPLTLLLKKDFV